MVVAAWSLGIGSCWIGACNEKKVKNWIDHLSKSTDLLHGEVLPKTLQNL
jgi:hypothetical protein